MITILLFVDDTTIMGRRDEIKEGTELVKRSMEEFEGKNDDDKEEKLMFASGEGKKISNLRSWIVPEENIKNRNKRVGTLWFRVKNRLKNTRLSKRRQARTFEVCVDSALFIDCATRTWYKKDVKNLQQ